MTLNPFRAIYNWRWRIWNRNVRLLIDALDTELPTLTIWLVVFPGWSLSRVHAFVDEVEQHGYVSSRLEDGGPERNWMRRRVVAATDLGRALAARIAMDSEWPSTTEAEG